jgi:polyhydroxybutyrate depolymerase
MGTTTTGSLVIDGLTRTYLEHRGTPNPTTWLLVLHGRGGSGSQMQHYTRGRFDVLADRDGWGVLYPDGEGGDWNAATPLTVSTADDVAFLVSLLARVRAVNANFGVGISNGAAMIGRLFHDEPKLLDAAVQVSGEMAAVLRPTTKTVPPTLVIHGTADPLVPYMGWSGQGSVPDYVTWLASLRAGLTVSTVTSLPNVAPFDGCTVDEIDYSSNVRLLRVNGGVHTWPSGNWLPGLGPVCRDIDGADVTWAWCKARLPT